MDASRDTGDILAIRLACCDAPAQPLSPIVLSDASGAQTKPAMISDGEGGTIVAWADGRDGPRTDIFATRIDADGERASGWQANGTPACTFEGRQTLPLLASDGRGGAYVVWSDERGAESRLYLQRISGAGVVAPDDTIPTPAPEFRVDRPWPNPTTGASYMYFSLAAAGSVRVAVLDIAGRVVRRLLDGQLLGPGEHFASWDGKDERALPLPAGAYFVRLRVGSLRNVQRIVLLR